MKIIAIGRNYTEHINELNNEKPDAPVVFMKPDTALLKNNEDFYHPSFSEDIHHELELVIRIAKEGKHIAPEFALKYIDQIGIGIDFTARDLQSKLKAKGLPWEISKAFNGSAPVSQMMKIDDFSNLKNINFSLNINGKLKQKGNSAQMLFSFEEIIAYVSQYFTLKTGDLIFTGTPSGVSKVSVGDHLEGFLEDQKLLDFYVK